MLGSRHLRPFYIQLDWDAILYCHSILPRFALKDGIDAQEPSRLGIWQVLSELTLRGSW